MPFRRPAGTTGDRTAGTYRHFGAVGTGVRTKGTRALRSYGLFNKGRWHAMARVSDHCTRRAHEEIFDAVVKYTMLWCACHRVPMGLI
jgi:hypothetical protein